MALLLALWRSLQSERKERVMNALAFAIALSVGGLVAGWHGVQVRSSWLPERLSGQTLVLTGQVKGVPTGRDGIQRFQFHAMSSERSGTLRVRLSWYGGPELFPGDQWCLKVRLKHPLGNRNPGGFDLQAWAAREGIQATGYVVSGEWLSEGPLSLSDRRDRFRTASGWSGSTGIAC